VVAINVGGAVIPTLMSIYLLIKRELWVKGLVATAIVALGDSLDGRSRSRSRALVPVVRSRAQQIKITVIWITVGAWGSSQIRGRWQSL